MEEGENILEAILDDDDDNLEDVDMVDVEEGEFVVDDNSHTDSGLNNGSHDGGGEGGGGENAGNLEPQSKNQRRRRSGNKKKRKNKKRGGGVPGSNVTDVNWFVLDTCRRLKEKKSYMVYTAVGCLGVSALSDLVKEVYAIQSCGGQMTVDGRRFRTGGGILWNIMKTREPMAYKEIMKKAKEFEKQFRQQSIQRAPEQNNMCSSQRTASGFIDETPASIPDSSQKELTPQFQHEQSSADEKRKSVHERIRVPVSYDDLLGDDLKNDEA
uniref:Phosphorylated adapter RNA export protein n=1 Tax=Salix viminalis TaxID=40686 RepID=A0A6N2L0T3_SALVM